MENELEDGQQQLTEEVKNETTQTTEREEGGDADFDAGFAGTPTGTPEKPAVGQEGEKPQDQTTAAEKPADEGKQPTETPAAPEYVQITKDQLEELMARAREVDNLKAVPQRIDQAFGKLGDIGRIIQGLQKQQTEQPQGEPLKLSEADFAELKQQFPEVAELQLKGMQRVLERIRIPGADPQAIDKVVNERSAALRTEVVDSRLDEIVDGDWRQEVNKPEFTDWIKKQPADVQALADSHSLRDAATLLRKFKSFRNTPAPAPVQTPQQATPTVKSRAIAAAVPPKGNQAVSRQPTADDDFQSGFQSG